MLLHFQWSLSDVKLGKFFLELNAFKLLIFELIVLKIMLHIRPILSQFSIHIPYHTNLWQGKLWWWITYYSLWLKDFKVIGKEQTRVLKDRWQIIYKIRKASVLTDPCDIPPLNISVHGNVAPLAHLLFAYNWSKGIKSSQAVFLKCHMHQIESFLKINIDDINRNLATVLHILCSFI